MDYDILGRVARQSVPTEINSSWDAAGDDAVRGLLWTYQKYDWMGRVVRKIATDGADSPTLNASDVLIDFEGCGCAGGLVTTMQGESVLRDDIIGQPTVNARLVQKVYANILGRAYKTEVMNWDGTTPYTTTVQTFNRRGQVTETRQYAGSDTSTTYQDTTAEYDGFGRMTASHKPEQQDGNGDPAYTSYNYNADGSISSVTDARGAIASYAYNSLGLVTNKSHGSPLSANITATPDVTYTYDNIGNRVKMEDGAGEVNYSYDELSRMTSETREITLQHPTMLYFQQYFESEYEYGLGGQLSKIIDPFGEETNYSYDKISRLKAISDSSNELIDEMEYFAFGGLKKITRGDFVANAEYNNRLLPSKYTSAVAYGDLVKKEYSYFADGALSFSEDKKTTNSNFDRSFSYDIGGRLISAKTGAEARGGVETVDAKRPYRYNAAYDVFGNLTYTEPSYWQNIHPGTTLSYTNNRKGGEDEDGRSTTGYRLYDEAGQVVRFSEPDYAFDTNYSATHNSKYDGDGVLIEQKSDIQTWGGNPFSGAGAYSMITEAHNFYIKSSVLGNQILARVSFEDSEYDIVPTPTPPQLTFTTDSRESVIFDSSGRLGAKTKTKESGSSEQTRTEMIFLDAAGHSDGYKELDPFGSNIGGYVQHNHLQDAIDGSIIPGFGNVASGACRNDGFPIDCLEAQREMAQGTAIPAELARYQGKPGFRFDHVGSGVFIATIPKVTGFHYEGGNVSLKYSADSHLLSIGLIWETGRTQDLSNQAKCDIRLAGIFGDDDAIIATLNEPTTLLTEIGGKVVSRPGGGMDRDNPGGTGYNSRESPFNGVAHLYPTATGKGKADGYAYTPAGYSAADGFTAPNPKSEGEQQSNYVFVYLPGSLKKFGYEGGLRINFVHSGTTDLNGNLLDPDLSVKNQMGSIKVGVIGNYGIDYSTGGSSGDYYVHNHLLFNVVDKKAKIGKRIDPRAVFCHDLGFTGRRPK